MFAERKLALVVKRLEAAQSERFEKEVGRTAWMKLAQEHLESARARLQKVKGARKFSGNSQTAENDFKVAETAFEADRSTFVGNTVARAVLVARLQEQVQSAERRLKEAEQSKREIELKGELVDFLHAYSQRKRKLEQHKKLVDWVEQRRQELVRASAVPDPGTDQPDDRDQLERLKSSKPQRHLSYERSKIDRSSASKRRKTKKPDAAAILSPRGGSKISKRSRKMPRLKPAVSFITPPANEETTAQTSNAQLATPATSNSSCPTARAPRSALLRRVRLSRVSKAWGGRLTQVPSAAAHVDDAGQPSRKGRCKDKPATARGGKDLAKSGREKQRLADAPVRRSPRLSEKPKICYPK